MIFNNKICTVAVSMIAFVGYDLSVSAMDQDLEFVKAFKKPEIGETLDIDTTTAVSQNLRSREGKEIKALLFHCVGYSNEWVFKNYVFPSKEGLPEEKKGLGVSAHFYISNEDNEISKKGKIFQLVNEKNTAYHAGVSDFRSYHADENEFKLLAKDNGLSGLNDISLGIEFQALGYAQVNDKPYYPDSFTPFSEEQIRSGILLSQQLIEKYSIPPENVLWHSDVSPLPRGNILFGKTDPGPLFPAERFAQNGIGTWPSSDRGDGQLDLSLKHTQTQLKNWGYPHIEANGLWDDATKYVLTAHYMHYLPKEIKWEKFASQKTGSIFNDYTSCEDFPYDKEALFISLENLNKKNYKFKLEN